MRFRVTRLCRGQGKTCFLVNCELADSGDSVRFAACSESGAWLPLEVYDSERDEGTSLTSVLVTPLLNTSNVRLIAEERNRRGDVVASEQLGFSRAFIKWMSRLNYKRDFKETKRLRDTKQNVYNDQIHVRAQIAILSPVTDEVIVKGYACAPLSERELRFEVLDGSGRSESRSTVYVGRTIETEMVGLPRLETSYTLRIPNDGAVHCLVVHGSEDVYSGFYFLNDVSVERLLAEKSPAFYLGASEDRYSPAAARRQRVLASLSPSDYPVEDGPLFSIVVPLYNTPVKYLCALVDSVHRQLYQRWELILVNASPDNGELSAALAGLADDRISSVALEGNLGIAENTNVGIRAAKGDYIVFADHDDELDILALSEYAKMIAGNPETDVLYSDEDYISTDGKYVNPSFKPDFNIDLLRTHNYITHLLVVRSSLAKELLLDARYDGAQDYDFVLRLAERTNRFVHARSVLYHWRMSETSTASNPENKTYAHDAGRNALQAHLDRCGLKGTAVDSGTPFVYRVDYEVIGSPLVSILIPNKDNADVLRRCIDSLYAKTTYANFEVVIIENNSVEKQTFEYYERLKAVHPNISIVTWEGEFNYSAINNFGAKSAKGKYLLLLNNDIEVIEGGWLISMLSLCQRPDVGAVGAKLLYPDDTVQHAGVMMTSCFDPEKVAGPMHVYNHVDRRDGGYMARVNRVQDLSAVTAACMLVRRDVFDRVCGFDEGFAVAYNDVDLCLRIREEGFLIVYDPEALLYHYESVSRGYDTRSDKKRRFISEQSKLRDRWAKYYADGDPYHSVMSLKLDYF